MGSVGCSERQTDESLGFLESVPWSQTEKFKTGLVIVSKEVQAHRAYDNCDSPASSIEPKSPLGMIWCYERTPVLPPLVTDPDWDFRPPRVNFTT